MQRLTLLVCVLGSIYLCCGAPYARKLVKSEVKKDFFISRGWGAGGMPFSVLYMNPSFSSSKTPVAQKTHYVKNEEKSLPQVRTAMKHRNVKPSHSVVPQLFLSYGWGPMG